MSHSVGQKCETDVFGFPAQEFWARSQDVGWATLTIGGLIKEESASKLVQIVSRVQALQLQG